MRTFRQLINESDSTPVRKGIFIDQSKGVMTLEFATEDGSLTSVTWDEYKKSSLPNKNSENSEKEFISALLKQISQFNKKVDYNTWVKKSNPSWEEKVDYLIKQAGAKYTKKGIK